MKTQKMLFLTAKVLLGLSMIIFGLNKFLGFIAIDPPSDPTAQTFLGTMFTSYLFKLVAVTEIIAGGMLMFPRTAFVGALMMLPVIVNIDLFHIAHDMPGNGIWLFPTILYGILVYFFSDNFKKLAL